jgi:hypothetical protein
LLSFFRSNNPGVVIFYILYIVLFRVCLGFVQVDTDFVFAYREPLSALVFNTLHQFQQQYKVVSTVLAAVLCFIQALMVNYIVNENKILAKKNYIAGLLYIIVVSFFKEGLLLSPALISLTFVIICTQKIFGLIRKEKAQGDVFDVGFLIAIAALFYFPAVLFILFAYVGLATVRPFTYKEWIIVLVGFLSPFVLVFTYYTWNDKLPVLMNDIINANGKSWVQGFSLSGVNWILPGVLIFFTMASFVLLPGALYSSLIQVRKYSTSLVFIIFLIIFSFGLQHVISTSHWVFMALPLSVIFSMVLMQIKNDLIAEVIHIILILLVLAGQYLPVLGII